ncbi:hypothetical protein [Terribacillus saccharophilus]|uniref:hypothetical protein n=1 Tax=Terribacillus saccharophilus TaxID=361277 RepID=UPI003D2D275E
MKRIKIVLSLLVAVFVLCSTGNTVFASTSSTNSSEVLSEIESLAHNSEEIELVDANTLPKGTPTINFESVEEFEQAVKALEQERTEAVGVVDDGIPLMQPGEFSIMASRTDRLKVFVKPSWNPLKSIAQPTSITVDLGYSYSGKKFTKINKVTSFSLGFPTDWIQTSVNKSFYSSKTGVSMELLGYHLVGANIKGQPVGAKVRDEITFKYKLGGTKTLYE